MFIDILTKQTKTPQLYPSSWVTCGGSIHGHCVLFQPVLISAVELKVQIYREMERLALFSDDDGRGNDKLRFSKSGTKNQND